MRDSSVADSKVDFGTLAALHKWPSLANQRRPDRASYQVSEGTLDEWMQTARLDIAVLYDPRVFANISLHGVCIEDLMLVADCAQTLRFLGLHVAVDVLIADPDARVTAYFVVDTGHRDAAFLMQDHLGRCPDDLRIDIGPRTIDGVEVEHHDPQGDADMRSGDSNTRRGVHRLKQVVGQLAERPVKHGYGLCRERKARVGITDDRTDGHDRSCCTDVEGFGPMLEEISGRAPQPVG